MNIVIIDDDIFVSGALKTILEASGDITVSATGTDGKDAVRLFRTYRPDVLLMDIRMKELSGLDASAEILKEFPDAKILLLTTFSDDEYIVRALKLGAKGSSRHCTRFTPDRLFSEMKSFPRFPSFFKPVRHSTWKTTTSANGSLRSYA